MISKQIRFVTLSMVMIFLTPLHCVRNPADIPWGDNGESVIRNNYVNMEFFVRKSDGELYGASEYDFYRLDTADFAANRPPADTPGEVVSIHAMGIDTSDNILLLSTYEAYVLYNGSDTLQSFDFYENERIYYTYFSVPVCVNGRIYFSTYEFNSDLNYIRVWDGSSSEVVARIYAEGDVAGIVPETDTLHVFTSSRFFGSSDNRHFYLSNGDETEVEITGDPLSIYDVVRIGKRFFAFCGIYSSNEYRYSICEILENDSLAVLVSIPSEIDRAVKTGDAWYLHEMCTCESCIYKVTAEGVWKLPANCSNPIAGALFLDRENRPALFYAPTRRVIHIDSLDGYEQMAGW
ncbi:MAG: hypothetical protein JW913_12945 [Chitinispirillaceae bacterium]|nr:hypothetical protein [Chitinispirillaceae bacterium]